MKADGATSDTPQLTNHRQEIMSSFIKRFIQFRSQLSNAGEILEKLFKLENYFIRASTFLCALNLLINILYLHNIIKDHKTEIIIII